MIETREIPGFESTPPPQAGQVQAVLDDPAAHSVDASMPLFGAGTAETGSYAQVSVDGLPIGYCISVADLNAATKGNRVLSVLIVEPQTLEVVFEESSP